MRKVLMQVIPIIVVALGGVTRKLGDWVGKLGISLRTAFLQTTALLGTAWILRKVNDTEAKEKRSGGTVDHRL